MERNSKNDNNLNTLYESVAATKVKIIQSKVKIYKKRSNYNQNHVKYLVVPSIFSRSM